jgi:hypothetical protein
MALAAAALGVAAGCEALADQLRSRPESTEVLGCRTELYGYGRWLGSRTTCEVVTGSGTVEVETERWHPAGTELFLRSIGDTVFDPECNRDEVWFLPGGLLAGGITWWLGLPPRNDPTYGRHAAPRERARRTGRP